MSSPKPAILLVPGAASYPYFYDDMKKHIEAADYEMHIPQLRTVEVKSPAATMEDDAQYIHAVAEKIADQGKDIIMVAHSYGGQPMTESVRGLVKTDRAKEGKKGGVVRLVYLTSLAAEVGKSMASTNEGDSRMEFDFLSLEGEYLRQGLEGSAKTSFNDLPLDEAIELVKQMPLFSAVAFQGELTYPAYNYVPVSYVKVMRDLCLPPWWQQERIETIEASSGRKVDVHELQGDHCCPITRPKETAEVLLKIFKASVAA